MKRLLLIGFCLSMFSVCLFGQAVTQKMILGKWYLVRHTMDSTPILDCENPEALLGFYLKKLHEEKPDATRQDSVDLEETVYRTNKAFENYFLEYKEDNTYRNTVIKEDANEASEETEGGTYQFIPAEQKIIQKEPDGDRHEIKVAIRNKILILQFKANDNSFVMEFKKR